MKTGAQKKRLSRIIACAALLGIVILLAAGCSQQTKYKVLTFFFTGVPSPGEERTVLEKKRKTPVIGTARRKREVRPVEFFAHGPYAAKKCFFCHNSEESTEGSSFGIGKAKRRITLGFTAPMKELCIECHTRKSPDSAASKDLWLHGPVAFGVCTICHDSHKSKYRFLLRVGPDETCIQCHPEESIMNKTEHDGSEGCISCHNPHFGKDRMLLKRDYDEVY